MSESVFVRGESKSSFEGMTREQILAAIVQAIEGGTISDVDAGFITKIKELNHGYQLRFWVGTSAEYNQLVEDEATENNVLYIKTDDTSPANISAALESIAQRMTAAESTISDQGETIETLLSNDTQIITQFIPQTNSRLQALESMHPIPVGGVMATTEDFQTAEEVAEAAGFGTWGLLGTTTLGANTVKFWNRAS